MQFKSENLERQWNDPRLRADLKQQLSLADAYATARHGKPLIITSIFRPDVGSTHSVWRSSDSRASRSDGSGGLDFYFSDEEAKDIEGFINWLYVYSDKYRACVLHENRGAPGKHFHFQVPAAPLFLSLNVEIVLSSFIRWWMTQEMTGIGNWG